MHSRGMGVEKSLETAGKWLKVAATNGYTVAKAMCAVLAEEWKIELSPVLRKKWLVEAALYGSRCSLSQLKALDIDAYQSTRREFRQSFWAQCYNFPVDTLSKRTSEQKVMQHSMAPFENIICSDLGTTMFHGAAMTGSLDLVKQMLEVDKVNIDIVNERNETALFLACRSGHAKVAEYLLAQGANAQLASTCDGNGLHWISECDNDDMFELAWGLLQRGAEVDKEALGESTFFDDDARCYFHRRAAGTPLHFAVRSGNIDAVQVLLCLGADPYLESQRFSPICYAVCIRRPDILDLLLSHTDNFNANRLFPDLQGKRTSSLLTRAIIGQERLLYHLHQRRYEDARIVDVIEILVRHGATISNTPQDQTMQAILWLEPLALNYLLSSGNEVTLDNKVEALQVRGMVCAITKGKKEIFEILIRHGADPHAEVPSGSTTMWSMIHSAIFNWHTDTYILERLIELGVDVNHNKDLLRSDAPIFYALHQGSLDAADRLIRGGATLDVEAKQSQSGNVLGCFLYGLVYFYTLSKN